MGRKSTLTSLEEISEINLTPLMDLTFILLIAFIITYPLIEQGIPVNLPKGEARDIESAETRTVSVDENGQYYLDDIRIDEAALAAELTDLGAAMPDITVYIRADADIAYGRVVEVLKMLHAANITRTALITQPEE